MNPEQTQGLLAAAAQMLQQSGPSRAPTSFGQIMGGGLSAYQGATEAARRRKLEEEQAAQMAQMRAQQMQMGQLELAQRQRGDQQEQALQGAYGEAGGDPQKLIDLVSRVNPMEGMKLRQQLAKAAPKYDSGITWVNGPDGKPVGVRTADDGSIKQIDGVLPRDKLELAHLGGKDVAYNPFGLQPGQTFQRTVSPDTAYSGSITMRGQNMTDARGREDNRLKAAELQMGGKPPPGYRWNADGTLAAIPGGPGDKLPESQQKQVVGVNNLSNAIREYRADLANFDNMDALRPDARATMGTKYNNMMLQAKEAYNLGVLNGPDFQILQSVITDPRSLKGVITSKSALDKQASELDRIMQQVGQVSGQARQPQNRPGASAAAPTRKPPMRGQVIDGYRFKGGDPADQNNWERR
jgi:hypothetical protein